MSIGNEIYVAGSYIPSFLNTTNYLPYMDYPREPKIVKQHSLNISVIIITAFIFIAVISWFNVLSHWYEDTFIKNTTQKYKSTYYSLGYAVLVTVVVLLMSAGIYYFNKAH